MAKERVPFIPDSGQLDIADAIPVPKHRLGDPIPGLEKPHQREQSVQSMYLDEYGREMPNPVPMSPPIGYRKQPTIADQMRQMIRMASYEASQAGAETEEEANDFDVGEDMDPHTPYEHEFEINPELEAMIALQSAPPAPVPDAPVKPVKEPSEAAPLQPQAPK